MNGWWFGEHFTYIEPISSLFKGTVHVISSKTRFIENAMSDSQRFQLNVYLSNKDISFFLTDGKISNSDNYLLSFIVYKTSIENKHFLDRKIGITPSTLSIKG